jgi:hypothetical protein
MKYIKVSLISFYFILVLSVGLAKAQKEIFLKQVDFVLEHVSDVEYENEYFMTIKLTKGVKYVFKITNEINDRPGLATLELIDADVLILTNIFADKYFESVNFQCNKTEFYDLLLKFPNNELGHCQVDISMLQ